LVRMAVMLQISDLEKGRLRFMQEASN
jgi:hypothetical protein